jgi:hypothetical protein
MEVVLIEDDADVVWDEMEVVEALEARWGFDLEPERAERGSGGRKNVNDSLKNKERNAETEKIKLQIQEKIN